MVGARKLTAPLARVCVWLLVPNNGAPDASDITVRGNRTPPLSLSLADLGGVCEGVLHALPDVLRNFDTVSARP
jgi:hypothetical protein